MGGTEIWNERFRQTNERPKNQPSYSQRNYWNSAAARSTTAPQEKKSKQMFPKVPRALMTTGCARPPPGTLACPSRRLCCWMRLLLPGPPGPHSMKRCAQPPCVELPGRRTRIDRRRRTKKPKQKAPTSIATRL